MNCIQWKQWKCDNLRFGALSFCNLAFWDTNSSFSNCKVWSVIRSKKALAKRYMRDHHHCWLYPSTQRERAHAHPGKSLLWHSTGLRNTASSKILWFPIVGGKAKSAEVRKNVRVMIICNAKIKRHQASEWTRNTWYWLIVHISSVNTKIHMLVMWLFVLDPDSCNLVCFGSSLNPKISDEHGRTNLKFRDPISP